jgi:hypothetical protein
MNSANPPRLAAWILQEFGSALNQEALAGDLNEAFQQGRSKAWYWRQVLAAVRWWRVLRPLLFSVFVVWSWTFDGSVPTLLSRPAHIAVLTAAYFVSFSTPGIKRGRLKVLLMLLLAGSFGLLCFYRPYPLRYWIFLWIIACNFVIARKARRSASHPMPLRELVCGDQITERQRMIARLEQTMMEETDPELRQAYAESIAALRRHLQPGTKVVE